MLRSICVMLCVACMVCGSSVAQVVKDIDGAKDHPLFTRMTGYCITEYEVKDFDKYTSVYLSGDDATWEGKTTVIGYTVKDGAKQVSMLQIERNFENALKKIGGKILSHDDRVMEGKVLKDGAVTYVHVEAFNDGRNYSLQVVETKPMDQVVVADASALSASIAATGKAAVYGIYFDTGKSIVKPESGPAIEEITKLLKTNPGLTLYVVGHTDNVGTLESNLKLSSDRADAVVKVLTGKGIAASRLKAAGVGPYCPVASNKTDAGKAQNRRVELVDQK
jgi:OmpA-OmpF porin, OOP family